MPSELSAPQGREVDVRVQEESIDELVSSGHKNSRVHTSEEPEPITYEEALARAGGLGVY